MTCEPKLMIETVMEMSCDTNITWVQDADQAFNIVGTRMEVKIIVNIFKKILKKFKNNT